MALCEHMWGLKTLLSRAPLAKILWKGVFLWSKSVSQERLEWWNKKVGIQHRKNALEDGEGKSWKRSCVAGGVSIPSPDHSQGRRVSVGQHGSDGWLSRGLHVFKRASAWIGDGTEKMEVINKVAVTKTKKKKKKSYKTVNITKVHEGVRLWALFMELHTGDPLAWKLSLSVWQMG